MTVAAEALTQQVTVDSVGLDDDARPLSALARIDYSDGFLARFAKPQGHTAEEWARAMLEGAPQPTQQVLRRSWSLLLGFKMGPSETPDWVLGWKVRDRSDDHLLLGGGSRLGMEAELLFYRRHDGVLLSTLMQLKNPLARLIWTLTTAQHQAVVPRLLRQGVQRQLAADGG